MRLKISFFLLLFFAAFSAQSFKVIYDFKWKPQKTATEYSHEYFALVINQNQNSEFLSYIKFKNDSTKTAAIKEMKKVGEGSLSFNYKYGESKFSELIIKNYSTKEITFEKQLYDKLFIIPYHCTLAWKIDSKKDKINGYNVQKATTEFGGRKWTAWFTQEIPIQDGPYKFHGLPGLIVKINDSENEFIYEIKSLTKELNDLSERNFMAKNIIKTTAEKYQKIWEDYRREPASIFNYQTPANSNDGWMNSYTIGGGDPNDKKFRDSFNAKQKIFLQSFENQIEIENSCLK
ncbi:GLPGLI family protein [Chryseobacterium sp.]|uniref:GLPGLI family protein n=1 Tax=Chryseobacterium sp. TaxID=1871047 RepID=UPI00289705E3|nr:GLPGLI family protein [Chryseobacterium sp.]